MPNKILIWGELPPNTYTGISINNRQILEYLRKDNQKVYVVEEYGWNKNIISKILHYLFNYLKILRRVSANQISILYFNLPLSNFGIIKIIKTIVWVKLLSPKTKTLAHIHRGDFISFYKKNQINKLLLNIAFFFINELIVLSDTFSAQIQERIKKLKIKVLPNTSELEKMPILKISKPKNNFVCISNYIKSKGIAELVELFTKKELSNSTLTIFGGTYDIRFKKRLIQNIATSKNIRLLDEVSRTKLYECLIDFDALILPSWNEGQPLVILEAMSIGLPVISTMTGDIPNMLGNDYKFLAKPVDNQSLFDKICSFTTFEKKEVISKELYERYMKYYSNELHYEKVKSIFYN